MTTTTDNAIANVKAELATALDRQRVARDERASANARRHALGPDIELAITAALDGAGPDVGDDERRELVTAARETVKKAAATAYEVTAREVLRADADVKRLTTALDRERRARIDHVTAWCADQPEEGDGRWARHKPSTGFEDGTCVVRAEAITLKQLIELARVAGTDDIVVNARGYEDPDIAIEFDAGTG